MLVSLLPLDNQVFIINDLVYYVLTHWALKVIGLDKRVATEVIVLKNSALRMLEVRQFDDEALFRDPCLTFQLDNVLCESCTLSRNLDLCRDVTEVGIHCLTVFPRRTSLSINCENSLWSTNH